MRIKFVGYVIEFTWRIAVGFVVGEMCMKVGYIYFEVSVFFCFFFVSFVVGVSEFRARRSGSLHLHLKEILFVCLRCVLVQMEYRVIFCPVVCGFSVLFQLV